MRKLNFKNKTKRVAKKIGGEVLIGGMAVAAYTGIAVVAVGIYAIEAATITYNKARDIARVE